MRELVLCSLIANMLVTGVLAQTPPRDRPVADARGGRISGRVVAAESGNPLARATVLIQAPALKEQREVTTDANGRYDAPGLPAGSYNITVSRRGYVTLAYGQTRPFQPGREVEVRAGQTNDRIDFALSRGGVITGRITDQNGEPQPGVQMSALQFSWQPNGARRLEPTSGGIHDRTFTDDLGQFRLYGLMPGSYIVAAGAMPGLSSGPDQADLGTTYFPGTTNVDEAQAVEVEMAQEVPIHFALQPAQVARVSGTVVDSSGQPIARRSLMLATRTESSTSSRGVGITNSDGTFDIPGIAPGHYTVDIPPAPSGAGHSESASFPISVKGDDITGLLISTRPGATVIGRVVWEGTSPKPAATLRITLTAAEPMPPMPNLVVNANSLNGNVDNGGNFRISGVQSGYVLFRPFSTRNIEPWTLKSVRLHGADITDVGYNLSADLDGVEVVMTDRQTSISGTARDARRRKVMEYIVVFVPTVLRAGVVPTRFIRTAWADQKGRYHVRSLPPGTYFVAAVDSLTRDGHYNPAFQKLVRSAGTPLNIEEGESVTLDLQLLQ